MCRGRAQEQHSRRQPTAAFRMAWMIRIGVLCLSACSSGDAKPTRPQVDAATQAKSSGAPLAAPSATANHRQLEQDARALLMAWTAAQNTGDFAAYERLYAARFTGVKRS